MLADALQNIDEVGVRIDAVQSAGDDQALRDADVLGVQTGLLGQKCLWPVVYFTPQSVDFIAP